MAHLPSTLPTANPLPVAKQLTTLVWYLSGLTNDLYITVGLVKLNIAICRSAVPTTRRLSFVSIVYALSGKFTVAMGVDSKRR
jgi:hypothetical protein